MSAELDRLLPPVRCDASLLDAIDHEVSRRRAASPGVRVTRADVVRSMLWDAIGRAALADLSSGRAA